MDKRKLVNIILKDLEEVKILAEEVAENEDASLIEIELALNRAKLLIQEIELLRELAGGPTFVRDEIKEDTEEDVDQVQGEEEMNYPEPELEITNYNEEEFSVEDELPEIEEDFGEEEQEDEEQAEADEEEEQENDILEDEVDEDAPLELDEDELDEDDWVEEEEELEEENEEPAIEEEKQQPVSAGQPAESNSSPRSGFREINIDDDDDDIQPIRVSSMGATNTRPPMREIPKPEDAIMEEEKSVVSEKFHKERTLNETLGENKTGESKLTNGPIASLKSAIGLNDRFLFIREIFNNDSAKYNEIIDNLDKMNQIQDAVEYLRNNLSMQKNEASMKFVELLKRRFTK